MDKQTWAGIKKRGSTHYKTGGAEPIDLYRSIGVLEIFALCNLIKYAFRLLVKFHRGSEPISAGDIEKMHHYLDMIQVANGKNPARRITKK